MTGARQSTDDVTGRSSWVKAAGASLVFVAVAVAAVAVAEHRSRIAAALDGLTHRETPDGEGRLLSAGQISVLGTRIFVTSFSPGRLTHVGSSGDLRILAMGNHLRLASTSRAGLYFVYFLEAQHAYSVDVEGEVLKGTPRIGFRCRDSSLSADRKAALMGGRVADDLVPVSLNASWFGNAQFDVQRPADSDSTTYDRVTLTAPRNHLYRGGTPTRPGQSFVLVFQARVVSGGPEIVTMINRGGGEDGQGKVVSLSRHWDVHEVEHDGKWGGRTPVQVIFARQSTDAIVDVRNILLFEVKTQLNKRPNLWGRDWVIGQLGTQLEAFGAPVPNGKARYLVAGVDALGIQIESAMPFVYRLNAVALNQWRDHATPAKACGELMDVPR